METSKNRKTSFFTKAAEVAFAAARSFVTAGEGFDACAFFVLPRAMAQRAFTHHVKQPEATTQYGQTVRGNRQVRTSLVI